MKAKKNTMPPSALKVYILLCARNKGQPFPATTKSIKADTRLEDRAVVSALKDLQKRKLIVCTKETNGGHNMYSIPLPVPKENPIPVPLVAHPPEPIAPEAANINQPTVPQASEEHVPKSPSPSSAQLDPLTGSAPTASDCVEHPPAGATGPPDAGTEQAVRGNPQRSPEPLESSLESLDDLIARIYSPKRKREDLRQFSVLDPLDDAELRRCLMRLCALGGVGAEMPIGFLAGALDMIHRGHM